MVCTIGSGSNPSFERGASVTVTVDPAIVSVLLRVPLVLAATLKVTIPLPPPEAPEVIIIHVTGLAAVHVHPLGAETVTEPKNPPDPDRNALVLRLYVHGAPACVTGSARPAIVSVPVRGIDDGFAVIEKATVWLPVPEPPLVMTSQSESLDAVHAQVPAEAFSTTERFCAVASGVALGAPSEYVHGGGGALPPFHALTSRFASTEPNPVT